MDIFDLADLADPEPEPRRYIRLQPTEPFKVPLPDELLRIIFETAIRDYPYFVPQFMLVARWVRLWLIETLYTTLYIDSNTDIMKLPLLSESRLQHIHNLRIDCQMRSEERPIIREMIKRAGPIQRLAIRHDFLHVQNTEELLLQDDMENCLRELEVTDPPWMQHDLLLGADYSLETPAFAGLTHLRLGNPLLVFWEQLTQHTKPELTRLTHFAVDFSMITSSEEESDLVEAVTRLRRLIASPSRAHLQRVVVEIPNEWSNTVDGGPVYAASASGQGMNELLSSLNQSIDYRRFWLGVGLGQKVKILQMTKKYKHYGRRTSEWKASTRGLRGFWERAEELGQVIAI